MCCPIYLARSQQNAAETIVVAVCLSARLCACNGLNITERIFIKSVIQNADGFRTEITDKTV
jgi:hypothetical protein